MWPIRLARVFAGSFASLVLATFGHQLGGGQALPVALLAVLVTAVSSLMWVLSRHRLGFGQLLGLLLLAQIAVHLAGMVTAGMAPMGSTMLVGHGVAIGLSAVVLAHGERCVWAIAERLGFRAVLLVLYRCRVAGQCQLKVRPSNHIERLTGSLLAGGTGLRGPPIGMC